MREDRGTYWFDDTIGHVYELNKDGLQLEIIGPNTTKCIAEGHTGLYKTGDLNKVDGMLWEKYHWKLLPNKSKNFNSLYEKLSGN